MTQPTGVVEPGCTPLGNTTCTTSWQCMLTAPLCVLQDAEDAYFDDMED
jgi:hypothetical protein